MAAPEAMERMIGRSEPWTPFWPRFALQSAAHVNRRRHALRHVAQLLRWYLFDTVGVALATSLTVAARSLTGRPDLMRWTDSSVDGGIVFAQCIIAVWAGLFTMNAYEDGDATRDVRRITVGVALGLVLLHWSQIWQHGSTLFTAFLPSVVLYCAAVLSARRVGERALQEVWPRLSEPARALMLGSQSDIATALSGSPLTGSHALVPVAQLDPAMTSNGGGASTLESSMQTLIHENDVDTALLCGQFDDAHLSQIMSTAEAAGCRVISISRTFSVARLSPTLKSYGNTPVVELTQPGIRGRDMVLKRGFDLLVACTLVLLLSPILLLVALLVRRSSPGPILFRQERVGYRGRKFHIYKFRSMRVDAEQRLEELRNENIYADPRLFKMVDDPRVTPLGHFIRRSSLDELPQLFNVIGGSMSLVGPRPPLPREVASYGDRSYLRFDVKPGITGPWQVNGRNTITSFDEVIALEAAYVNGWTILRDFAILAKTVPVVLRMEGAQ